MPIGVGATRDFIREIGALAHLDVDAILAREDSRLTWYAHSVDSTYLTGKRVFVFGDATHALAAARVARDELGFTVVAIGTYSREYARDVRALAEAYGAEAIVTDDFLAVEEAITRLQRRSWCSARRWSATSPSGSASPAR